MKWEAPKSTGERVEWGAVINTVVGRPGRWLLAKEFTQSDRYDTPAIDRAHSTLSYLRRRYADDIAKAGVEVVVARTVRGGVGLFARKPKS